MHVRPWAPHWWLKARHSLPHPCKRCAELSPHTGGFTMAEFNPLDDDADVPAVAW